VASEHIVLLQPHLQHFVLSGSKDRSSSTD
jgi:hypothetical protein